MESKTIRRYDLYGHEDAEDLNGDWVKFSDHAAALSALTAAHGEAMKKLEADAKHWERSYYDTQRLGQGLYQTIVKRMAPHFPAGDRGLDWDVLPSTIGGVCEARNAAQRLAEERAAEAAGMVDALRELHALVRDECTQILKDGESVAIGTMIDDIAARTSGSALLARVEEQEKELNRLRAFALAVMPGGDRATVDGGTGAMYAELVKRNVDAARASESRAAELQQQLDGMTEARNRFNFAINEVARVMGYTDKDCYAPEVTVRRAVELQRRVEGLDGMVREIAAERDKLLIKADGAIDGAWRVISNVSFGNWNLQGADWKASAETWRDAYYAEPAKDAGAEKVSDHEKIMEHMEDASARVATWPKWKRDFFQTSDPASPSPEAAQPVTTPATGEWEYFEWYELLYRADGHGDELWLPDSRVWKRKASWTANTHREEGSRPITPDAASAITGGKL